MRPIRLTGVTGTSQWVPLDAYSAAAATVYLESAGAPTLEITLDNVFDSSITPKNIAPAVPGANALSTLPVGTRGVRGIGMVAGDILHVSQQGIQ